jgi:hypothetical protein
MALGHEEYAPQEIPLGDTRHPFYGSRKMVVFLKIAVFHHPRQSP